MKKNIILLLFGIIVLSISTSAFAGYYSIGLGNGGNADAKNLTLEIGSRNIKIKNIPFLVGIGLPFIDHGDDKIPSETIDSSCPHNDYKSRGKKPEGLEVGLFGKMGMELFSTNVYMSIIGGLTRVHEIHLTQSNPTKKYYEQSSGSKLHGVFGISVGYFVPLFEWKEKLNIQIDFDNRRGFTSYIGWGW